MARHVSKTGIYSLEFESKGSHCYLSVRFWKQDTLTKVQPHSLSSNRSALGHLASPLCILPQATAFQCVRFLFESWAASRMVSPVHAWDTISLSVQCFFSYRASCNDEKGSSVVMTTSHNYGF